MIENERLRLQLVEDLTREDDRNVCYPDTEFATSNESQENGMTEHILPGAFYVQEGQPDRRVDDNVDDESNVYNIVDDEMIQHDNDVECHWDMESDAVNAQVLAEPLTVRDEVSQLRSKFVSGRVLSVEQPCDLPSSSNDQSCKKTRRLTVAGLFLSTVVGVIIGLIVKNKRGEKSPPRGIQFHDTNSSSLSESGCLSDRQSLYVAVDSYLSNSSNGTDVAIKYGWPIGNWCVSRATDFMSVFDSNRNPRVVTFNEPLNNWDVSNGVDFFRMFYGATAFNQDLSKWKISRANTLEQMFYRASLFNQNLSAWDVSSVTSMNSMFTEAKGFNGDLSSWNVSRVSDMSFMFSNAVNFNSDISRWQVWNVQSMTSMFELADSFNQDISGWRTLNLTTTSSMFKRATQFNQDISKWSMSKVITTDSMFEKAHAFNQDISGWNMSSVESMENMFKGANSFNQDLCSWKNQFVGSPTTNNMLVDTNCTDPIVNLAEQPFSLCQPCA